MVSAATPGRGLIVVPSRARGVATRMALIACALVVGSVAGSLAPRPAGAAGAVRVVVRAVPGAAATAADAVERAGGQVLSVLSSIDQVVATVPASSVPNLQRAGGVVEVTEDAPLHMLSASFDPVTDVGSAYSTSRITGAADFWKAGYTGQGVDVAVIDSGVVPVDGLTAPGKVVLGPDLSWESQNPATAHLDTYGHGTHVAGLIAGRDDAAAAPYTDPAHFTGIAPDARIVSVKVADAHGAADVSQVIAAIDWVAQHRNDAPLHIRVLNLAFGTDSTQSWRYDPLAYAAEAAWRLGIVVVVSGGNDGTGSTTLADPAYDPNLIAVGAADTRGTVGVADDTVANFSSTGRSRHPDLVAPGVHMVSLRDPGSYVDQTYGATGQVGDRFFRGSGTSQAAAVVSGAAALLLSQRPWLTPDQVKQVLVDSAQPLRGQPATRQGAGELDLHEALHTGAADSAGDRGDGEHSGGGDGGPVALGTGTLEGARGTAHVSIDGIALTGERDIFGRAWNSAAMARAEARGSTWSGGAWNGSTWSGSTWSGSTWSGSTWSGSTWSGSTWSGSTWSGSTWSGSTWSGSTWSGSTWSGSTWSGSTWSGSTWSGSTWSGGSWPASTWSGSTWSGSTWSGSTWSGSAWLTGTWD
ncbi:MAG TPA: S8 family serine peptidase [Candidatus Angelobacter sp.]|jgi:subtilisin family serine protease|nr:S8 family serine peptidase [Candidatus Angelobacter sp.]